MPILLILSVLAACLPLPWPAPLVGVGPWGSLILTAAATLAPALLAAMLSAWVVRALRRAPVRRSAVVGRYSRLRRVLSLVNLLAAAGAVLALGWGWTVWHADWFRADLGRPHVLAPGAELLVPAPFFLSLLLGWVAAYPAERAFHRTSGRADKPANFWSLPGYVMFHLRQFTLLVGLPVGLCVTHQGLERAAPNLVRTDWFQAVSLLATVAVFVLLPRLVKPVLGLRSLSPGPARDQLEATARRLNFRYSDLLLWPTHGAIANAMVVGVVPWARYVIFTDRLLDGLEPDELDAVFGHEAGHAKHGHLPYYALFFILSASAATAVFAALEVYLNQYLAESGRHIPAAWQEWMALPPLVLMGAYIFVVFGLLSRRCERQADVFGCRTTSCHDARCGGHDEKTVLAPAGRGLCPAGVLALVRALDRVAELNGMDNPGGRRRSGFGPRVLALMRAWQHGPVSDRIEFLLRLSENPTLGDRVDRKAKWFRRLLTVALLAAILALGSVVGWVELWRML
jgi:Zn-dependent protease with chaperone function